MSNPFSRYAGNPELWRDALIASLDEPVVDGVTFPGFPPESLQRTIHGTSNADALRGAEKFVRVVRAKVGGFAPGSRIVDFGAGWGRMTRACMPFFELSNIVGLEPNAEFCRTARMLNPYVAFINSALEPPCILAPQSIDYVIAFSVFSHLPEELARKWLAEFARITRPGGAVCITSWGEEFIHQMETAPDSFARSRAVAEHMDIVETRRRFDAGEFVYGGSQHYGTAVVSERALRRILPPAIEVESTDSERLAQTLFVLRVS